MTVELLRRGGVDTSELNVKVPVGELEAQGVFVLNEAEREVVRLMRGEKWGEFVEFGHSRWRGQIEAGSVKMLGG